jgi:hypothetical protein
MIPRQAAVHVAKGFVKPDTGFLRILSILSSKRASRLASFLLMIGRVQALIRFLQALYCLCWPGEGPFY